MEDDVTEAKGVVFNIQRFSIHDGPGIRTTVFLKGCPLRCGWCSNPESASPTLEIITRDAKCIGCGRCLKACSEGAVAFVENHRIIQWEKCNQCGKCAEACPSGAIERTGEYMTVARVIDVVGRDAGFYGRSDGGMTLSGGEPLVQRQFTLRLLEAAKKKGLHTALDTTGQADWQTLDEILNFTDLVLYDVKHPNSVRHREATGVPNEQILDNLRRTVARPGLRVWVRHAVVPQFSDSEDEVRELCKLVLTLKPPVEKISLLPYHKFGEVKYAAMGRAYPWKGIPVVADEQVHRLRRLVESYGIKVDVGR
jgi:glycyl-radical enzyme activating protein